jgi:hypothetical protein
MGDQSKQQDVGAAKAKGPKVGQPGEEDRTSQQNAGSTEGGGTRNAGNTKDKETQKSRPD